MRKSVVISAFLAVALCSSAQEKEDSKSKQPLIGIRPSVVCGVEAQTPTEVECEKREVVRLFIILNKPAAALKVLCTTKVAKEAFNSPESCEKSADAEKP